VAFGLSSWKTLGLLYERLEEILLVVFVVLMVSLGFLQIVFRNLISIGIVWVDPLVRHLVLWIALLGASVATREDRHIRIDVLSGILSPPARRRLQGSLEIFSAAVCLLLVSPAIRFMQNDYQAGKVLALGIPMWVSQVVMPAILLVLGVRFLLRGCRSIFSAGRAEAA
jgi:TRAP-type C4-dicarboxylate transport system permease small subunit